MENYVVIEQIGSGSQGPVHQCQLLGPQVAVKSINMMEGDYLRTSSVEAYLRESRILALIRHPNLVRYFHLFVRENTQLCVVNEFCPQRSVADLVERTRGFNVISEPVAAWIAREVTKALAYLHERHIVHGRLKLTKILVGSEGEIKLTDFGVHEHSFMVSYELAPELVANQMGMPNAKTDLWLLGICTTQMLQAPSQSNPTSRRSSFGKRRNLVPTNESWSDTTKSFIQHCCQFDARNRPFARNLLDGHPFLADDCASRQDFVNLLQLHPWSSSDDDTLDTNLDEIMTPGDDFAVPDFPIQNLEPIYEDFLQK